MLGPARAAARWALGDDLEGRPLTLLRRQTDDGATYAIFRGGETGGDELYGLPAAALVALGAIAASQG